MNAPDHTCYGARFLGATVEHARATCLACSPGLAVPMVLGEDHSRHCVPVRQADQCEHIDTVCAECIGTWAYDYGVTLGATDGGAYLAGQLGWTDAQVAAFDLAGQWANA